MSERDKFLTEAMGECWHEWFIKNNQLYRANQIGINEYHGYGYQCTCGFQRVNRVNWFIGDVPLFNYRCINNDFSTWEGFGKLWGWVQEQEWFWQFSVSLFYCESAYDNLTSLDDYGYFHKNNINPDIFAAVLYKYLLNKEEQK